nr:MAG TPA: hypothetical protein [Caudoviricetes sp.]
MISLRYSRLCFTSLPISPSISRDIKGLSCVHLSPVL